MNFDLPALDAARFAAELAQHGVRLNATSAHRLRAVTHLEIAQKDVLDAVERLARVLARM